MRVQSHRPKSMKSLQPSAATPILQTLGIGNPWRGDDAAGLLAAHALHTRNLPGVTVIDTNVVAPALIDLSFCSSHAFHLAALLNLARALNRLPPRVWVFGVEAGDFTQGQPVGEAVRLGVTACVAAISGLLTTAG